MQGGNRGEHRQTTMIIRDARVQDINQWSTMRASLWPQNPEEIRREIKQYFAGTSISITQVYIADADSEIAGFLELNIRNFAEGSCSPRIPYVEAWYIKPAYQGKGYGKRLMQTAEQWAIAQDCSELASDTTLDNLRSIAMHKHLGFYETERVVCFLKKL